MRNNDADRLKVIFDTGIVLQAGIFPDQDGPARRCLRLMDDDKIVVYVSPRLRSEYEVVLYRDVIRAKYPILIGEVTDSLLNRMDTKAIFIHPVPSSVSYPRDPKDEPILNLAIHIQADFIVARDKDLLDLDNQVRGIRIVDPVTFLRLHSDVSQSNDTP